MSQHGSRDVAPADGAAGLAAEFGLDVAAIQERYSKERDKRLRPDNEDQFVEVSTDGAFSKFLINDPWADDTPKRQPVSDEVEVLIVGGGWVGLVTAARVIQAGINQVRIVEAGSDFGGTWYWNRYPGAQCDIESYIYLPLLEETKYIPKERYSYAPEIYEHARRIGETFGLYDKALFGTWVEEMHWNDKSGHWVVTTNRGDYMRARFVCLATGAASRPRLPGVAGIEKFGGKSFHTSRWDYDYTGGNPSGELHKLADKRVAVIGTGATGVQVIPHVAKAANHTFVFQRTPSSVDVRGNAPTDRRWAASLKPGWQKKRIRAFDAALTGAAFLNGSSGIENDNPMRILTMMQKVASAVDLQTASGETVAEVFELADHLTMEAIRQRVETQVRDPDVAEKLKPYYNLFCKRPTWNDEYFEAFNLPNVDLIDVSAAKGVDRISEKGVVANGHEYEVDCIIFASGFEITSDFRKRLGIDVFGEKGEYLFDHWGGGMRTMHALMVSGFPNMFIVGGLFGFTLGSLNYTSIVDDQAEHVSYIISELRRRGSMGASPTRDAEDQWIGEQMTSGPPVLGGAPQTCTPGYYNQEGRPARERRDSRREGYSKGRQAYLRVLEEWRDRGQLDGLVIAGPCVTERPS